MPEVVNTSYLEMSVLGAIMRYPDSFYDIRQTIGDDINCFNNETFKEIYKVLLRLDNKGESLDYNNIFHHLTNANILLDNINEIWGRGKKDEGVRDAERLIAEYRRKEFIVLNQKLSEKANDPNTSLEELVNLYQEFLEKKTLVKSGVVVLRGSSEKLIERIDKNLSDEKPEGTSTGFELLDKTNGFHNGEFIVIAGASSHGKTSFALTITRHAIKEGARIAYYSLEMDHISLTARLTAMESNIAAAEILYKKLAENQKAAVLKAIKRMPLDNLFYDDNSTSTFENIMSSIRMMKKRYNIHGVVVDYLQILNVNTKSKDTKEQIMAGVARRLKNLAIELGIWIIGLSQLNRDKENPQPKLDRIRDSGQIAEAADIVIFVYRPELYNRKYEGKYSKVDPANTALIDIAKGRNIGIESFIVDFKPTLTLFVQHTYTEEERDNIENYNNKKKFHSKALGEMINNKSPTNTDDTTTITEVPQEKPLSFTPYTPPLEKEPEKPFGEELDSAPF